jgi:hypothetical protein
MLRNALLIPLFHALFETSKILEQAPVEAANYCVVSPFLFWGANAPAGNCCIAAGN